MTAIAFAAAAVLIIGITAVLCYLAGREHGYQLGYDHGHDMGHADGYGEAETDAMIRAEIDAEQRQAARDTESRWAS